MTYITRKKIAVAFTKVLVRDGFDRTAVSSIMRMAKMRRQTFYEYFEDKYAVAEWVVEDMLSAAIDQNFDYLRWEDIFDLVGYELDAKQAIFRQLADQRAVDFVGRLAVHLERLVARIDGSTGNDGGAARRMLCLGIAADWDRRILGVGAVDYEVVVGDGVRAVEGTTPKKRV